MKIAILGAGAMGCNLGGHLKKGGAEVWFIDPYSEHMDAIAERGLIWINAYGSTCEPLFVDGAVSNADLVGVCDIVIVLTKGSFTRAAIQNASALFDENTYVVSFQNGIGNVDILKAYFSPENIGYGVMNCGGTVTEPGKSIMVKLPLNNVIFKRMQGGKDEKFEYLEKTFIQGGLHVLYSDNADQDVWIKLGVNCMFNMPGGITRLNIYQLVTLEEGDALIQNIADEVIQVAAASGIIINKKDMMYNRDKVIQMKSEQYASGAVDMRNKRSTEVDFLNGAVAAMGKKVGVATPVNETIAMLARILQATYEIQF